MPASRSRTERWRECLTQIRDRGGSIEITPESGSSDSAHSEASSTNLVLRARVLSVTDDLIEIEPPVALGSVIPLHHGAKLLGVISIGQNRWMFHTRVISAEKAGRIQLQSPKQVERCRRRTFDRISTATLSLPAVRVWPVLDVATIGAAEVASRLRAQQPLSAVNQSGDELTLPEVGLSFNASLTNVGGGGVGLMIAPTDASSIDRSRLLWLQMKIDPQGGSQLCAAARVVHSHIDSQMNLHAGLAFEFAPGGEHRAFIARSILEHLDAAQARQTERRAG